MNVGSQIATRGPPKCHLLTLPAEICNIIFRYVVISASSLILRADPTYGWLYLGVLDSNGLKLPSQRHLSIARTCKSIYREKMPTLRGSHLLECGDACEMGNPLKSIGQRGRRLIRSISFHYRGKGCGEAFKLLTDCSDLKELHIVVSAETLRGTRKGNLDFRVADGSKQLRKIRGCKEVRVESVGSGDDRRPFSDEDVQRLENTLQDELCREKVVAKATRKTKGRGKT